MPLVLVMEIIWALGSIYWCGSSFISETEDLQSKARVFSEAAQEDKKYPTRGKQGGLG